MEKTRESFADWSEQQLRQTFGLRFEKSLPTLESWIDEGCKVIANGDGGWEENLRAELE